VFHQHEEQRLPQQGEVAGRRRLRSVRQGGRGDGRGEEDRGRQDHHQGPAPERAGRAGDDQVRQGRRVSAAKITVYGVTRSRTLRVLWMLEELGLPYEHVKTNFATGDTRSPEYLAINPNGHVPALRDGDTTLCESMAINLYLARKYDKGLWPRTVEDEGRTFQWSLWVMTE